MPDLPPLNWSSWNVSLDKPMGGNMTKKRFTAEQIVAILRDAEKSPTNEEVLRKTAFQNKHFIGGKRCRVT